MIPWESCVLWLGYPIQNGVWPDISKHDNDGVIIGAFWEGDSLEFDGIDDYINCGNDVSLNITGAITIEVWLKLDTVAGLKGIVSKYGGVAADQSYLLRMSSAAQGNLQLIAKGLTSVAIEAVNAITDTKWHCVVGIYDLSYLRLYVDGLSVGTPVSTSGNMTSNSTNVNIGKYGSEEFDGKIAHVRIYNIALSAEQVKEAYEHCYKLV